MGRALTVDQILTDAFSSHDEPVWVLEVRPDHDHWLGSNPAADALLEDLDLADENLEVVLGHLGVPRSLIMGGLWSLGSFSTSTARGIVHATKLCADGRPPLMVASLHTGDNEVRAWSDHSRLVLSLRVNEEAQAAIRMTQTAVVELEGVVSKLQGMLHDFNQQMNVAARPPLQKNEDRQDRPLTGQEQSRQG